MSESARTRGSAVEQLVWCEKRIEEQDAEIERLRAKLDTIAALPLSWRSYSHNDINETRNFLHRQGLVKAANELEAVLEAILEADDE